MSEMDRRGALRTLFGGVILAGAGVGVWTQAAADLPQPSPRDQTTPPRHEPATYAQVARPRPTPVHRPRPRPRPPVHRRRRRWECWWHRGRRHCGWRWR